MSLIIKGINMPKNGEMTIAFASDENGEITLALILDAKGKSIEHKGVTEIPAPHGRLIDADALKNRVAEWRDCLKFRDAQILCTVIDMIHKAPTVIKAEVSE